MNFRNACHAGLGLPLALNSPAVQVMPREHRAWPLWRRPRGRYGGAGQRV